MASIPAYTNTPNIGAMNAVLSTAMTNTKAFDGTEAAGTAMALVFTAGASGSRIDKILARYTSTNGATASGTTDATVIRLWANNGSVNTTAGNNQLIGEIAMPAETVTALGTTVLSTGFIDLEGLILPATYKIYAGITVAVGGTNCGVIVNAQGGDF